MATSKSDLAASLDFVGRAARQRKPRIIEIDAGREDKDDVLRLLLTGMGYTIVVRQLPLGDFQWDSKLGRVVIERKTPADAREVDRLRSQLGRLRAAAGGNSAGTGAFPIILIDHRRSNEDPWKDHDLDNLLLSVQGKIHVAHCLQGELAHRLDSIYRWSQKAGHTLMEDTAR